MGALPPGARGSQESGPGHLGFLGRKKYGSFGFAATRSLEPQKTARHVRFGDPPVSLAPLIDPPDVDGGGRRKRQEGKRTAAARVGAGVGAPARPCCVAKLPSRAPHRDMRRGG